MSNLVSGWFRVYEGQRLLISVRRAISPENIMQEQISEVPDFSVAPNNYFYAPIPDKFDLAVETFVKAFEKLSEQDRQITLGALNNLERSGLGVFAMRCASLAVREASADLVRYGIIAVLMSNLEPDFHEYYLALATLRDASERLGLDFPVLLKSLSGLNAGEGGKRALTFLQNTASLAQMDRVWVEESSGGHYTSARYPSAESVAEMARRIIEKTGGRN
jgi:hypothetical protein